MRSSLFTASVLLGTFGLVACSAVLGVDDYTVSANTDAGTPACTVNADCPGDNIVCRKADGKCISLVNAQCNYVLGDYKNDNAVIIGSVLPTDGENRTSGLPCQNGITLAVNEFRDFVGGLPPLPGTSERRPIVLVGCNDDSNGDTAVAAAKHLVNEVRVPAIIGAAFSGITIRVANEVTVPGGTFLISPSATSVALTGLQDNGLVWRTTASDLIQSDGHVALYPLLEAKLKSGKPGDVKVAIAYKSDAYGQGLRDALSEKLIINGKPFLDPANTANTLVASYGNSDANPPTVQYAEAIEKIFAQKPNVIYLMGIAETITQMLEPIEQAWEARAGDAPRPFYLLADGGAVAELPDLINRLKATNPTAAENLRRRVLGTIPGTTNAVFQKFRTRYNSAFDDGASSTSGVPNSYDALYNIAYSIASLGGQPVTGPNIAAGMSKLVGGTPLETGTAAINTAFTTLSTGNSIDYNGASGPLNYDLTTGDTPGDIQIWCSNKNSEGNALPPAGTNVLYEAATNALKGDLTTLNAPTECSFAVN